MFDMSAASFDTPIPATGLEHILGLVVSGTSTTRADLARHTGLARSTVSQRVDDLIKAGLLEEVEGGVSSGGRPPRELRLRRDTNLLVGVDLGATHCDVAVADVSGEILARCRDACRIDSGPHEVLGLVARRIKELLTQIDRPASALKAIGIGVPGPVEFSSGRPNNPPIMPGWNGFSIPTYLGDIFGCDVVVDNDVTIMAIGEHRQHLPNLRNLLFVKVATGIGCGIIANGAPYRGADGCAGDIGHVPIHGYEEVLCRCGNVACLEAIAGGAALVKAMSEKGLDCASTTDLVRLADDGQTDVLVAVRSAANLIGEVLATLVNFFNPEAIVIGGTLIGIKDTLVVGIREAIYRRSLPLATSNLAIIATQTGRQAGILGAIELAREQMLAPARIKPVIAAIA